MKKSLLAFTVAAALGATSAQADVYDFSGVGFFTMIDAAGAVLPNPSAAGAPGGDLFGVHTPLTGLSMSFDTATGSGSGVVDTFSYGGTPASAHSITMQAIGDGLGGPGTKILGSMLFDYGTNVNIPVYLIADGAGIFSAIGGGLAVNDVVTGGVASSVDAVIAASAYAPLVPAWGAIPFAMTTLDVIQDGDAANACGTTGGTGALIGNGMPLCDDGVSGVRMATAPFPGYQANFDMTSMTVTNITVAPVPVPAAVWLFGSGLLGLVGVARRRKA